MPPFRRHILIKVLPKMPRLRPPPPQAQRPRRSMQKYTSSLELSPARPRSTDALSTLPSELLFLIITFIRDGIMSACLGLASYRLYLHHFSMQGKVGWEETDLYMVEIEESSFWRPERSALYNVLGPITVPMPYSLATMVRVGLEGRVWDEKVGGWLWRKRGKERTEEEQRDQSMEMKTENDGDCCGNRGEGIEPEQNKDQIEDERFDNKRRENGTEAAVPKKIELVISRFQRSTRLQMEIKNFLTKKEGIREAAVRQVREEEMREWLQVIANYVRGIQARRTKDHRTAIAKEMLVEAYFILSKGVLEFADFDRAMELTDVAVLILFQVERDVVSHRKIY